jgi:peptide/nickel transport system permease protein
VTGGRSFRAGAGLLIAISLLCLAGSLLDGRAALDSSATDLSARLTGPAPVHPLGTDALGRDVLSRLLRGGTLSLQVGFVATLIALTLALLAGGSAAWAGGLWDALVCRLIEAFLCFPFLVLVLLAVAWGPAALGSTPDGVRVAVVIGCLGWPGMARLLRAELLRLKTSDLARSAIAAGASPPRLLLRHLLPNASGPLLVAAAFFFGAAILSEASLSVLGFGVRPPQPSWGGMLREAGEYFGSAWWLALFPGLALFATLLGLNLVAEGLRTTRDS